MPGGPSVVPILMAVMAAALAVVRSVSALAAEIGPMLPLLQPAPAQTNALDQCPFGFSCDNATTYSLANYCGRMAEVGLRWIRGFPSFNVLEPEQGRFVWEPADKFMATADRHGMRVCGLFLYSTPWIPPGAGHLPVQNLPAWAEYVSAVVNRYKDRVKHWEVWNETPNFMADGTAGDYARTVVAAYEAAKKADPSCQVGLSIQSVNVHWIQQVIAAGARDHFDFIAVHPYEVLGLVESDGLEAQFMSIVPTIRKMLAAQNPSRTQVPIWFTEIGYDAGTDEPGQASALVKAFVLGIAQGVERIFWFEGIDGDSGPMGLLRADGTPRLAYTAMRILTSHLGVAPRYVGWVLLNGRHYGFVFEGATGPVMVAWARPGAAAHVQFESPVHAVDTQTGAVNEST
ncbi:MAG: endo-1,4-beta-xylanase, partial [Armatimonadetes bacterium]|nr:endo-1,4-beta-xylanase [Armatimonadota bacterium]